VLGKGGRTKDVREFVVWTSLLVSAGVLVVSALVEKDVYGDWKWLIVTLIGRADGAQRRSVHPDPQRAADAFDIGNACTRPYEEAKFSLGGQLSNTAKLSDRAARDWFETLQKKRELLEDKEVNQPVAAP
jgi:hypothetical protein